MIDDTIIQTSALDIASQTPQSTVSNLRQGTSEFDTYRVIGSHIDIRKVNTRI